MALTRPKAAQINFDLTNISDPVIRLNSDKTDANDTDIGFIFERGSTGDNAVLVWDESADQFVLGTTTAVGTTSGDLTITNGNLQVDTIKNREQRYTTSNMMKFNQLYTGAAIGSYFEQNEYQKIVTIIPAGSSENYQVSGRILCQTASSIQTINFIAGLRSNTLPDLDWSITYTEQHNGTAHFKPQLWVKETTTAGFIFAIQKISSGSLYGTVTVDLDIIPRSNSQLDNVTVNTTQDSEQTSIDAGYTANDMTLVQSISGSAIEFSNAYTFPTTDGSANQILQTDGSGTLSFADASGGGDVVEDTTPQLGGDLDVNGQKITSASNGHIEITPNGTGKVGIGTSSPSQKLVVNGTDARIYLTGANTDIDMDGSASGQLSLDGNAYAFGIALNSSGANLYTNSVSRDLIFGVNETEVMRVTNDSVGIGTSSPSDTLTVAGTGNFSGNVTASHFVGTATEALYADLAEKYVADAHYEPGTVMVIGGDKEVTASNSYMDPTVSGIVSTNPAFLMNKDLTAEHVVDLALTGRVPCKVHGIINRGDMIVSGNIAGVGTSCTDPKFGTVVGKALENYNSKEVGIIEVIAGRL